MVESWPMATMPESLTFSQHLMIFFTQQKKRTLRIYLWRITNHIQMLQLNTKKLSYKLNATRDRGCCPPSWDLPPSSSQSTKLGPSSSEAHWKSSLEGTLSIISGSAFDLKSQNCPSKLHNNLYNSGLRFSDLENTKVGVGRTNKIWKWISQAAMISNTIFPLTF